jgi:hypothetical protein
VDDLAAERSDRFGPLPDEARRLLEFARLRCRALDLDIDSITRHPGMIMIGHHDRERIDRLRQAAAKKNRVVRVVDQKTAVVPPPLVSSLMVVEVPLAGLSLRDGRHQAFRQCSGDSECHPCRWKMHPIGGASSWS